MRNYKRIIWGLFATVLLLVVSSAHSLAAGKDANPIFEDPDEMFALNGRILEMSSGYTDKAAWASQVITLLEQESLVAEIVEMTEDAVCWKSTTNMISWITYDYYERESTREPQEFPAQQIPNLPWRDSETSSPAIERVSISPLQSQASSTDGFIDHTGYLGNWQNNIPFQILYLEPLSNSPGFKGNYKNIAAQWQEATGGLVNHIKQADVSLYDFRNWDDYGVILIDSHGKNNNISVSRSAGVGYSNLDADRSANRIVRINNNRYHITPAFFDFYYGNLDYGNKVLSNTYIHVGVCEGLKGTSLSDILLQKGAAVVTGYNYEAYIYTDLACLQEFTDIITAPGMMVQDTDALFVEFDNHNNKFLRATRSGAETFAAAPWKDYTDCQVSANFIGVDAGFDATVSLQLTPGDAGNFTVHTASANSDVAIANCTDKRNIIITGVSEGFTTVTVTVVKPSQETETFAIYVAVKPAPRFEPTTGLDVSANAPQLLIGFQTTNSVRLMLNYNPSSAKLHSYDRDNNRLYSAAAIMDGFDIIGVDLQNGAMKYCAWKVSPGGGATSISSVFNKAMLGSILDVGGLELLSAGDNWSANGSLLEKEGADKRYIVYQSSSPGGPTFSTATTTSPNTTLKFYKRVPQWVNVYLNADDSVLTEHLYNPDMPTVPTPPPVPPQNAGGTGVWEHISLGNEDRLARPGYATVTTQEASVGDENGQLWMEVTSLPVGYRVRSYAWYPCDHNGIATGGPIPNQTGAKYIVADSLTTAKTLYFYCQIVIRRNGTTADITIQTNKITLRVYDSNILGDADGNGKVTAADAATILRHCVQLALISAPELKKNADVNENEEIDAADASAILRWLVDLPTAYPIGEPRAGGKSMSAGGQYGGTGKAPKESSRSGGLPEYTLYGVPSLESGQIRYDLYIDNIDGHYLNALQFRLGWNSEKLIYSDFESHLKIGGEVFEPFNNHGTDWFAYAFAKSARVSLPSDHKIATLYFDVNNGVSPSEVLKIAFENTDILLVDSSDEKIDSSAYVFLTRDTLFYPDGSVPTTYTLVTDVSEVVGGKYVLVGTVGSATRLAMNNTLSSGKMGASAVTIVGNQVINPPAGAVWFLQELNTPQRFSIRSAANDKYLNIAGNTTESFTLTNSPTHYYDLTSKAGDPSDARFASTALGNRCISIYQTDFRCYLPSSCRKLQLYREDNAPDQPTPTPVPTMTPAPTATPSPGSQNTYVLVTDLNDVTDGEYVLVGQTGTTSYAMTSTLSDGTMGVAAVNVSSDNRIKNAPLNTLWQLEKRPDGTFSLKSSNKSSNAYLSITGNATTYCFSWSNTPTKTYHILKAPMPYQTNAFRLKTTANGNRNLSIFEYDFRAYGDSHYRSLYLYKKAVAEVKATSVSVGYPAGKLYAQIVNIPPGYSLQSCQWYSCDMNGGNAVSVSGGTNGKLEVNGKGAGIYYYKCSAVFVNQANETIPFDSGAVKLPVYARQLGDANLNGTVNAADASYILRSIVQLNPPITHADPERFFCADVDGNGDITAADASAILRWCVQLDFLPPQTAVPAPTPTPAPSGVPTPKPTPVPTPIAYNLYGVPALVNGQIRYQIYLDTLGGKRLDALEYKLSWDPSLLTCTSHSNDDEEFEGNTNPIEGWCRVTYTYTNRPAVSTPRLIDTFFFDLASGISPSEVLHLVFSEAKLSVANSTTELTDTATYILVPKHGHVLPNGTPATVYRMINDVNEVTSGQYVLVGVNKVGNTTHTRAMNNTLSSGRLGGSTVTFWEDLVVQPPATVVWTLQEQATSRRFSLFSQQNSKYANITGDTTSSFTLTNAPTAYFDLDYADVGIPEQAMLRTTVSTGRFVSLSDANNFGSYAASNYYNPLHFYKLELPYNPASPTPTPIPTPTATPTPTPTPTGQPVYELVTSLTDITDGDYILVGQNGTTSYALTNTVSGGFMGGTAVTVLNNQIQTSNANIVWTFEEQATSKRFAIKNTNTSNVVKYMNITGNSTNSFTLTNAPTHYFDASVNSATNNSFFLRTTAAGNRNISIYLLDFRAYLESTSKPLMLYKRVS